MSLEYRVGMTSFRLTEYRQKHHTQGAWTCIGDKNTDRNSTLRGRGLV